MLPVRIHYKDQEMTGKIPASEPLINIFKSVKDRFGICQDASEFLVWTDSPCEVDNRPLGHLRFNSRDYFLVFIEKEVFQGIETFVSRFAPRMIAESSEIGRKGAEIVENISAVHEKALAFADPELEAFVLSVIPVERIADLEGDAVVEVITKWFKEEFFTFLKAPKCRLCQSATVPMAEGPVTMEEAKWLANVACVFHCPVCGAKTRFVRYNSVKKLLETREGRCGEFANCFGAVLAALGFDVRLVFDMADHIWVEFWSDEKGRYVHVDPCENLIDRPLVYEEGWNKDYFWVIAVGASQVQDVTKKYSRRVTQKFERRNATLPDEKYFGLLKYMNQLYAIQGDPDMVELIRQRQECDARATDETHRATLPEERNPRQSGQ